MRLERVEALQNKLSTAWRKRNLIFPIRNVSEQLFSVMSRKNWFENF